MKIVLLSGGSGHRLWPLSNESRSKQFLRVLDTEDGGKESMLQRIWRQLTEAGLAHHTVIATNAAQVDSIQHQLGFQVPIIVEPERRDTYPAVALSAAYLYSVVEADADEVIAVIPVDSDVEVSFFHKIRELADLTQDAGGATGEIEIGLLGARPDHPSTTYGYIVPEPGQDAAQAMRVSRFVEKPHAAEAARLIEQQALWNCGVFVFKLSYLASHLQAGNLPVDYEQLAERYGTLPKISFDYEVLEKATRLIVMPYDGKWKDVGTWKTLTENMNVPIVGNGRLCSDSRNSHIINELNIPVLVMGVSDAVVVASSDGILVTNKIDSANIKDQLPAFVRPMYEEKRWGWYRVLDYSEQANGELTLVKRILIKAAHNLSYQYHHKRTETWKMISGEGYFVMDGIVQPVKAGDLLTIPVQAKHAVRAVTDLEFIEIQSGSELTEDDIVRLAMDWNAIVSLAELERKANAGAPGVGGPKFTPSA